MRPPQLRAAPLRRIWLPSTPRNVRSFHATETVPPGPGASPTTEEVERARAHCLNLLRKYDAPAHTLRAFIPAHAQYAYTAIRAFNIDIASVADTTTTPIIGQMRMEFWRNTVSKALSGTPPKEPVAIMLAHANEKLQQYSDGKAKLSRAWLHRIISTREQHLGNPPYPDLSALESYAENTYSTMLYLTLQALPMASVTADHVASHIGKAVGIAAVLRGVPYVAFPQAQAVSPTGGGMAGVQDQRTQGAVLLPLDVMAEAGVKEEDVFRQGGEASGLKDAVFTVATRANDHLITAREMMSKLRSEGNVGHDFEHQYDEERRYSQQQLSAGPEAQLAEVNRAWGVFMPAVSTQSWLDRLQAADFDVFHPDLRKADWKLPWKAWWAFRQQKI